MREVGRRPRINPASGYWRQNGAIAQHVRDQTLGLRHLVQVFDGSGPPDRVAANRRPLVRYLCGGPFGVIPNSAAVWRPSYRTTDEPTGVYCPNLRCNQGLPPVGGFTPFRCITGLGEKCLFLAASRPMTRPCPPLSLRKLLQRPSRMVYAVQPGEDVLTILI